MLIEDEMNNYEMGYWSAIKVAGLNLKNVGRRPMDVQPLQQGGLADNFMGVVDSTFRHGDASDTEDLRRVLDGTHPRPGLAPIPEGEPAQFGAPPPLETPYSPPKPTFRDRLPKVDPYDAAILASVPLDVGVTLGVFGLLPWQDAATVGNAVRNVSNETFGTNFENESNYSRGWKGTFF